MLGGCCSLHRAVMLIGRAGVATALLKPEATSRDRIDCCRSDIVAIDGHRGTMWLYCCLSRYRGASERLGCARTAFDLAGSFPQSST